MGQFKPMIKMETTEPSIELKLKKGGKVGKKMADGGMPMGAMVGAPRGGVLTGGAPGMPALAARRRAMKAMGAAQAAPVGRAATMMGMKKGGKAHGGEMESPKQHKAEMHEMHKIEKELSHHEHLPAHKAHHGLKKGGRAHHFKDGGLAGKLDKFETITTIEGNEGKYDTTEMHTAKADHRKGPTGEVKEANAGGFKHGGKVHRVSGHPEGSHEHHKHMAKHHAKMHKEGGSAHHAKMHEHHKHHAKMAKEHHYAVGGMVPSEMSYGNYDTTLVHGARPDMAHGTGSIHEQNAGGFKRGGHAHHSKHHMATGGVMEANAGGYRKGGAAKKFAEGGRVQNDGGPKLMPQGSKPRPRPVAINELSGTYKKGGDVSVNKLRAENKAEFSPSMKAAKRDSNLKYGPQSEFMMAAGGDPNANFYKRMESENLADAKAMKDALMYVPRKVMGLFKGPGGSETVTEKEVSRTVSPGKKRGGKVC